MAIRVWDLPISELAEIGRRAALDAVQRQKKAGIVVKVIQRARSARGASALPATSTEIAVELRGKTYRFEVSAEPK